MKLLNVNYLNVKAICKHRNRELIGQYLESVRFSVTSYNMPHFRCRTWPYCNCGNAVRQLQYS